jgi:hypothetical protein
MQITNSHRGINHIRIRLGIGITVLGLLVYILGADPGVFGLDRSPVLGFVQIAVLLVGLAIICIGGYITLNSIWNGMQKTILADIGLRMVTTGYLVAVVCGMADIFGFGNHRPPAIPYFGPWQAVGVMVGEAVIAFGFLMIVPYPDNQPSDEIVRS